MRARRGRGAVRPSRGRTGRGGPSGAAPHPPAHHPPIDAQAHGAPALDQRAVDARVLDRLDAGGRARRLEQRAVEVQAALAQRQRGRAADRGEVGLGADAEPVIAHAVQRPPAGRLGQPQPPQHVHARRHQPFAARLLAREAPLLEQRDPYTGAPEQHRQRRAGDAAARDQDVRDGGHGSGTNRGLPPISSR